MASCRTGRIPLPSDPLIAAHEFAQWRFNLQVLGFFTAILGGIWLWRANHPHTFLTYKGPENPYARIRHRRYPAGGYAFGWGNNGLNRDCSAKEYECWSGYMGKEYTY
jgi:hypothetical protein